MAVARLWSRERWTPAYIVTGATFMKGCMFNAGMSLRTWETPSAVMRPVSLTARLHVWWWRRSLPAPATKAQVARAIKSFEQYSPGQLTPLPNSIRERTVWDGTRPRNWYDHKSNVTSFPTYKE